MEPRISVLLVNLNNIDYSAQCIADLLEQDIMFDLTFIDQNSNESGTNEFFDTFFKEHMAGKFYGKINFLRILNTGYNKPLNQIWNEFVESVNTEFVCFLNNDVRICPNFLSSAIEVMDNEKSVSIVNHVTNNKKYSYWDTNLTYIIKDLPYRQGWDLIFRKSNYTPIPNTLQFFFGDDYIFSTLYSNNLKGAYVLNSPMIHYEARTTQEKGGSRDCLNDFNEFKLLHLKYSGLSFDNKLCKLKPEFYILSKNDNILLSILICSLTERNDIFLSSLIKKIEKQIDHKPVELIIISDNAKRSIGKKRNDCINLAQGKYICFIDDDDDISDDYVELILNEIKSYPDVIVFNAEISFDGVNNTLVEYGREYQPMKYNNIYYRRPNHLMVHKKSNITELFKDVKTGEDDEWAQRMLPLIKTQKRIDKILYYYKYNTSTKKYYK